MGEALIRPIRSVLWELRTCWATGRRVSLSLDERCSMDRLEGHITRVASTDAFVCLGSVHVPADTILAVHSPSRLGDSTFEEGEAWRGRARRHVPQVEELPGVDA